MNRGRSRLLLGLPLLLPLGLPSGVALGLTALALSLGPDTAAAHDAAYPIAAHKIAVDTRGGQEQRKFSFKAVGDDVVRIASHDPARDGAALVVSGLGGEREGSTGRIELPAENWRRVERDGEFLGYVYKDEAGRSGGVTKIILKTHKLKVKARGPNWSWKPKGGHDVVWVLFYLEDEQYCAASTEESSADLRYNEKNRFKAFGSLRPGGCPEQLCGNGVVELGEACDDGNPDKTDGCKPNCRVGVCVGEEYDSTFEALQSVVFDSERYGCTNGVCHDPIDPAGGLDLSENASYDHLVDVPAAASTLLRVAINEPEQSFLYEKLLAKVEGRPTEGSPMPIGAPGLSDPHLRALRTWIRGGAPRDKVVQGTQADLGTCLPPADPLKIPPVDPPPAGIGVQVPQPPRPLPAQSESEVCKTVYFDFTSLVPDAAKIPCPERYDRRSFCQNDPSVACTEDSECPDSICYTRSVLNTGNECFAFNRLNLLQDPQSHHSIQLVYAGDAAIDDPAWGDWRYHFEDESNPLHGQPCDPTDIVPELGVNPGCATAQQDAVACIGYGPPDFSNFTTFFGQDAGSINLNIAQEPIKDLSFPDGVYDVMPMKGLFTWNSHAFNLTSKNATLAQYMNLEFATQPEQRHPIENIFDAGSIFIQNVPPFDTDEYCRTYTVPKDGHLFRLTSHTHRLGTLFRIWAPPNEPCVPKCDPEAGFLCSVIGASPLPECAGPRSDEPIYYSTRYSDPVQLYFDPPVVEDEDDVRDRTYLYCGFYDNGSTPTSPRVKRASTTPQPPALQFGSLPIFLGGPCAPRERACMAGENRGELCDEVLSGVDPASFCESAPDRGDGVCDACPGRGGVTTEDEMFILFGDYYCPNGCN